MDFEVFKKIYSKGFFPLCTSHFYLNYEHESEKKSVHIKKKALAVSEVIHLSYEQTFSKIV